MQIIWKALITYLDKNLREGKSVNMKKFGAFTFDIATDLPRISRRQIGADSDIAVDRSQRKHIHTLRPCFIVDPVLKRLLSRYNGKEEISPAGSQKSIFQQGFKMMYANPVPVANACQMGVDVVRSTLDIIYKAIEDLINIHDKDIQLQFGFACVQMRSKNLRVVFAEYLSRQVGDSGFETTMRRMNNSVSSMWRTSQNKMF